MSLTFGQITYLFIAAAYGRVFLTEKAIALITDSNSSQNRQYKYVLALLLITVYVLH